MNPHTELSSVFCQYCKNKIDKNPISSVAYHLSCKQAVEEYSIRQIDDKLLKLDQQFNFFTQTQIDESIYQWLDSLDQFLTPKYLNH